MQTWVIAGGVALAGMAAMGMGAVAVNSVKSSKQASWTHTELIDYLHSQGVSVFRKSQSNGTVAYFRHPEDPAQGYVIVDMMPDEKSAREKASTLDNASHWNRFVIVGRSPYADQIRDALK